MGPETQSLPPIRQPRFFFAVSAGMTIVFALWSVFLFQGSTLDGLDDRISKGLFRWTAEQDFLWRYMIFLTDLGGIPTVTMVTIMGAIWQNAIRHRYIAVAWFAMVTSGLLLNAAVKSSFDRPRPPIDIRDRAVFEETASYPSGHTMGSVICYGMLAYALLLPQRRRPRRAATLVLLTGIVLAIGFSRMYLRAHWFSDVVGGWVLGLAWLFFCLGWLERGRLKRGELAPAPS